MKKWSQACRRVCGYSMQILLGSHPSPHRHCNYTHTPKRLSCKCNILKWAENHQAYASERAAHLCVYTALWYGIRKLAFLEFLGLRIGWSSTGNDQVVSHNPPRPTVKAQDRLEVFPKTGSLLGAVSWCHDCCFELGRWLPLRESLFSI